MSNRRERDDSGANHVDFQQTFVGASADDALITQRSG
jgi:hypothetical protein